ncbi:MAG TPA: CDP-alcohol phosphatidyltransferase family protein [Jatrophihabitantaceae bacterium]|nr:CDP-alcohol phosphatidyltransferase family protein [Jatrophihabitantaceae bacterium]
MHTVRTGPAIGLIAYVGMQVALLGLLGVTVGLSIVGWIVGLTCGLATNAALAYRSVMLRPADQVTLVRATIVGAVAALTADAFVRSVPMAFVVALAVIALVLDAVDGWVARHTRTASPFGARFDMEVDAFLILVLSVDVSRSVGPWVLAIGAARYVFGVAAWLVRWLREPMPASYWAKTVAAIQGIALTTAVAGAVPTVAIDTVLAIAFALLAESFGHQVWWLARHHHVQPRRPVEAARRMPAHVA